MIFGWSAINFTSWVIFGPKMADFWTKNGQKFIQNDFFRKIKLELRFFGANNHFAKF